MKIAILGAGAFGTALGGILAQNGYDIDYYDSTLEKESLALNLETAKYAILCVPSKVAPYLIPHIRKDRPLIIATKGLLTDSYFQDFADWMVLSGPGFAKDIKEKKQTKFTVTDERVKELFATPYIDFDYTKDRRGVLMCGALKNVYALLAGFCRLESGSNESVKYLGDAAKEMKILLGLNGAKPETVDLACGKGDLKLTCTPESRNYSYGYKLSHDANYQPECTVEGLSAIKRIKRGEIKVTKDLPLLDRVLGLVSETI